MASKSRSLLVLAIGMAMGVAIALTQGVFAVRDEGTQELPLQELRTFVEILNRVKQGYVEDVSDEELLENAIRGMLDGLDPHSAYLNPDEFKEISISTSGKFGGLGIEVQMQNGFVRVVAPIDDTPAKRAGIQAGDLIIRIDDTAVKGLSLMDAVKMMRGEPGTDITLTVLREERNEPFKVDITRDIIRVKSVKSRMLEPGYGYLRITQFSNQTGKSLRTQFKELESQSEEPLRGLVLDLRNNPGGVLDAAVAVSDAFLDGGEVVSIRGRAESTQQAYDAEPGDLLDGRPLVVLVNEGSASASEIVAGALQDKGRAVIMGSRTFGKGSVQTIVPLQNEAALKLTTARYYTPSGRSIQAEGIKPDVTIQPVKVTAAEDNGIAPFLEADLAGSLENKQNGKNGDKGKKSDKGDGDGDGEQSAETDEEASAKLAEEDYALYEALNLLKGLHILSRK
ncbi:carboxyl-terminal protease [Salinisphaera sp. PC39]|uniref:S41 family peptidase n=1 Tax=Salinisphaera sp. PC39 TaxID=1304156 RepID=UPI00333EB183